MMAVEETGRTAAEAVSAGLEKLGIPREYVLVEILAEGARGFWGFGAHQARVRLTLTPTGERLVGARSTLDRLLKLMGVQASARAREHQGRLQLEVSGEDAGLLIGKHGQTLEALDFLLGRILDRRSGERTAVRVDVEGYRARREQQLEQRARSLARQVKETGEAVELEPMSPAERRLIHLALQGDSEVGTESVGDGPERRVVIKRVRPAGTARRKTQTF